MTKMPKAELCRILVERSTFYGSRTIKKINRWWTKNHNEITGHNERGARVAVGKAVSELVKYREGQMKKLMRLPKEDLVRMIKHKSARELERRYGIDRISEKELPPIELKKERSILISDAELKEWKKQSRKIRRRKVQPVAVKKVEQPKKVRRKRHSSRGALDYVKRIMQFNNKMHTVTNIAGIEG